MSSPSLTFNNGQTDEGHTGQSQNSSDNNDGSSKTTGRVRSACNACHQSKIRCSGGAPCQPCRESMFLCTYSPGRRLGRPKGSKNKRTLMQGQNKQKHHDVAEPPVEDNSNNGGDAASTNSSMPPLTSSGDSSMEMEYDLDGSSSSAILEDDFDFDQTAILGMPSSLPSMFGPLGGSRSLSLGTKPGDAHPARWMTALTSPYHGQPLFDATDVFKGAGASASVAHHPSLTPIDPALAGLFQTGSACSSSEPSSAGPSQNSTGGGGSSPTKITSSLCSCIQQHARLVYELGTLREAHDKATDVERVLTGVQLAQGPWQSLLHCPWGPHGEHHKEAFMLFSLSVRILLSSLQRVQSGVKAASRPGTRAGVGSSDRGVPADVGMGGMATSSLSHSGDLDVTRVSVGGFEVTGDTKLEVISVLIKGALQSILSAVSHQNDSGTLMDAVGPLSPYLACVPVSNGSSGSDTGTPESPMSTRTSMSAEAAQMSSQMYNMPQLHQASDTGLAHIDAAANDIQALLNQLAR